MCLEITYLPVQGLLLKQTEVLESVTDVCCTDLDVAAVELCTAFVECCALDVAR